MCGITCLDDALNASLLGADALGFVFYPKSVRFVKPENAFEIIKKLPPFVKTVGLFVNQSREEILQILKTCPIDIIQLHGDETPAFCRSMPRPVIKAFRVKDKQSIDDIKQYEVQGILLDAYVKGQAGGTGQTFNWSLIPKNLPNLILAGGLTPENVREAACFVKPYAVDVSSGLESSPAVKSLEKMKAFFKALNCA